MRRPVAREQCNRRRSLILVVKETKEEGARKRQRYLLQKPSRRLQVESREAEGSSGLERKSNLIGRRFRARHQFLRQSKDPGRLSLGQEK